MSILDKLKKNSTIKMADIMSDSKVFNSKDMIPTKVPMINVALSGKVDGGLTPGLTVIAGPSKHFKTAFSLLMASAFLAKYPDGAILFYDSEFGTPQSYIKSFGLDPNRIFHSPITNIEELKFDIMAQLEAFEKNDKVMIFIDSVGNLASKKEVEDALSGKSVADMTRAKALKSLFRMVTPHLTLKDIPAVVVNHTYKEQALFPRDIVSGGTGIYYSADNIWIIGRQQDKDSDGIQGYHFIINIEKSRFVKEKSKIIISVSYDDGISRWSGLLPLALEAGYVAQTKIGNSKAYAPVDQETGEILEALKQKEDAFENNGEFWKKLLTQTKFPEYIAAKYSVATGAIMKESFDGDVV